MSKKYDLSILIPARNEAFLARTVQDILEHKRGSTEILVGLDGQWANPGIPDHPDVTILYVAQSIGQRAMTNRLCQLSRAKWVMKLDAHCSMSDGFDVQMMKDMEGHDDWTMAPVMRNLHAFNWVCENGHKRYQGPSGPCRDCNASTTQDVVWIAKESPQSRSYRFDRTLHFQYFGEYTKTDKYKSDLEATSLTDSMSLQGSCFMLTREKYWELDICDEKHGSWGQQGVEVACKTWLSGGRVVINHKAYYAHMFRTQGGDFGFPYPLSGKEVDKARQHSRNLWLGNNWPLAKHDLNWLIEKFAPVPDWGTDPTKGIIYYTTNQLNTKLAHWVQDELRKTGLPIVSASLKPMPHFGKNVHLPLEPGVDTYFKQIIAALEELDTDIVFFCEHDVMYHETHFDFTPGDTQKFYYNHNFWRTPWPMLVGNKAVHWDANQVSGLVCYREHALAYYRNRLKEIERHGFNRSYEPGGRDPRHYEVFRSALPNIDVRVENTLTKSKWSPADFRDKSTCVNWQETTVEKIPGWDNIV